MREVGIPGGFSSIYEIGAVLDSGKFKEKPPGLRSLLEHCLASLVRKYPPATCELSNEREQNLKVFMNWKE